MKHVWLSLSVALWCGMVSPSFGDDDRTPASSASRQTKIFPGSSDGYRSNAEFSAHGLFLGRVGVPATRFDNGAGQRLGAQVQDLSLQLAGNIDPNWAGVVVLGNLADTSLMNVDLGVTLNSMVREAYAKTTSLPVVSFKFGEFLANFGKNNRLYPHAQPMIDQPIILTELFGGNGFRGPGFEIDVLIPSGWFFDVSISLMSARLVGAYNSPNDNTVTPVFRMEHDFDFGNDTSFGFGGSASLGDNSLSTTSIYLGVDATVKYKMGNGGFGFAWFNEFIYTDKSRTGNNTTYGFFTNPMFRFHPTFWAGLRFDYTGRNQGVSSTMQENVMIAWVPSSNSKWALQGGFTQQTGLPSNWNLMLQYNLTLGNNPAHAL